MPNDVIANLSAQIDANTVKLRSEMDAAAKSSRAAGREIKESMAEGRAGVKQLGEEIGINLNRHLASFLVKIPGVAPLMAAAFPIAAVVGIGAALVESGEKLGEFIAKAREAAGAIGEGMLAIQRSTQTSNHELELQNARLDEQIAKLEHKPVNGLAIALAEARVQADKLTKALDTSLEAMQKVLKDKEVGFIRGAVTGQAPTSDAARMAKENRESIGEINEKYQDLLQEAAPGEDTKKIESARNAELLQELQRQRNAAASMWNQLHGDQQKQLSSGDVLSGLGPELQAQAVAGTGNPLPADQTATMTAYGSMAHEAEKQIVQLKDELANLSKQQQMAKDEAGKSNREELEKYLNLLHRLEDEGTRLRAEEQRLTDQSGKIRMEIMQDMVTPLEPKDTKEQTDLIVSRIDAAKSIQQANREAAESQAEWNIKILESTGMMTRQRAAIERDALAVQRLQEQLGKQAENYNYSVAHPNEWNAKSNPEVFAAQMAGTQGQLSIAQQQQGFDRQQNTLSGAMDTMFNEWIQKATDLRAEMSRMWEESINGVNNVLAKLMTGEYKKGDWGKMAKGLAGSASKSALQSAEGFGLKALGLGGGGKLGTKGNPMHVTMEGGIPGVGSGAGSSGAAGMASKGLLGMLNNSNWASSLFGGNLFGSGGMLAGGLAGGGSFSPGDYLVGERGPEIMSIGSSGFMHNADKTRTMVSGGGGGGDIHYHIDARGTDPALTQHNVMRGMRQTHQQSVKDSAHVISEHAKRVPQR